MKLALLLVLTLATPSARADGIPSGVTLPDGTPEREGFGAAFDVDGDLAIVGAASPDRMGAAYLVQRSGNDWDIVRKLAPGGGAAAGAGYGSAVALMGNEALVGVPASETGFGVDAGRVVFFIDNGTTWTNPSSLNVIGAGSGDRFGASVALTRIGSSTYALVGAPGHGTGGAAFVFRRSGVSWTQVAKLTQPTTVAGDDFGASVDFDGTSAVIGAPGYTFAGGFAQGAAVFFENTDGAGVAWSQQGFVSDPAIASNATFGASVTLRDRWAAVGSPFWGASRGAVLFYERVGSSWFLRTQARGSSGAELGWSVYFGDVGGNGLPRLVAGAPGSDGAWLYALAFPFDPTSWTTTLHFAPTASGATPGAGIGRAVAFTEGTGGVWAALIGAPLEDAFATGAGAVYPYAFQPPATVVPGAAFAGRWHDRDDKLGSAVAGEGDLWAWGAQGDCDASAGGGAVYVVRRNSTDPADVAVEAKLTTGAGSDGERFGTAVDVDGGRIAVGASSEDALTFLNGAVYVFEDLGGTWTETARIEPSETNDGAFFGGAVALCGDRLIAGAQGMNAVGGDAGAVYVFEDQPGVWVQTARLTASDAQPGDSFGADLAFDGNFLVVGAPLAAGPNGEIAAGAGYVFAWDGTSWDAGARLADPSPTALDIIGGAVALQGNRLLLAGYGIAPAAAGSAHLFERSPAGWTHTHAFAGTQADESLGFDVAILGEALLLGAPGAIGAGLQGRLFLHRDVGSQGVALVCSDTADPFVSTRLGTAVAFDRAHGLHAAAGAPGLEPTTGANAGAVWSLELPDETGPVVYCATVADSAGCLPYIDYAGTPTFSGPPGALTISGEATLNNKPGLLMYGVTGRAQIPFFGGTLCIAPPIRRTPVQFTGGSAGPPDCSGSLTFDFTSWMQASADPLLAPGQAINAQYRYRDPAAAFGVALTNALEFTIEP